MEIKYKDNKVTFIIDTLCSIDFEFKGGSIALHKLAYEIASLDYYVYIFNEPLYPHSNIFVIPTTKISHDDGWWGEFSWENFMFNVNKTVTLYTQLTNGNPFNTNHNGRWMLDHYQPDKWESYSNDIIYNFGTFNLPISAKQKQLTIFDYGLNKFENLNKSDRSGIGYILHKHTPDWGLDFLEKFGATEIPHYNGKNNLDYLVEEFNKYEYLITFDYKTYYTTAASLCGTKSIILNPTELPSSYRQKNPIQMYGVAYGMNDIKWASDTIHLVRNHIKELEKNDKQTIVDFVQYWNQKLKYG